MILTIEAGSGEDPYANAYIDKDFFLAFFSRRYIDNQLDINSFEEDQINRAIVRATDYFEGLEPRMRGDRTYPYQALSWPRRNIIVLSGFAIESTIIPLDIKKTLAFLTYNALEFDLLPESITDGRYETFVNKEKIDSAVEVGYEPIMNSDLGVIKYLTYLNKYLKPANFLIRA